MLTAMLLLSIDAKATLYPACVFAGAAYGAQCSIAPTVAADLFGIRHLGESSTGAGMWVPLASAENRRRPPQFGASPTSTHRFVSTQLLTAVCHFLLLDPNHQGLSTLPTPCPSRLARSDWRAFTPRMSTRRNNKHSKRRKLSLHQRPRPPRRTLVATL
jgi:hypothetical protein